MVKNTEEKKERLPSTSIAVTSEAGDDNKHTLILSGKTSDKGLVKVIESTSGTAAKKELTSSDTTSSSEDKSSNPQNHQDPPPTSVCVKDEPNNPLNTSKEDEPLLSDLESNSGAKPSDKKSSDINMQLTVSGSGGPPTISGCSVTQSSNPITNVSSPPGPGPGGISSQHSPGSSSTSSSTSGGGGAGYTRQSNPRPRSYKHNSMIHHSSAASTSASSKHNNASNGSCSTNKSNSTIGSSVSTTTTVVSTTSLPASAVSAAPYIPPSHVMIHQPHLDNTYSRAPPPPGLPPHQGVSSQISHHPHMHASHQVQTHMSPVPPTYCLPPGDPGQAGHPLHGCPPPPPPPGVPPAGASWICYPHYDTTLPPGAPPMSGVPPTHGGAHIPTYVHHVGTQQVPPPPMAQHQNAAITNVQVNSTSSSNTTKSSHDSSSCKARSSTPSASISSNNYSHQQSTPSPVTSSCQSSTCAMTSLTTSTPTTITTSGVAHPHPPPPPSIMAPPPHVGSSQSQPPHVVNYHVHQGEIVSLQMGDGNVEVIHGKTYETIVEMYTYIYIALNCIHNKTL